VWQLMPVIPATLEAENGKTDLKPPEAKS
jgi:hypothetical protein